MCSEKVAIKYIVEWDTYINKSCLSVSRPYLFIDIIVLIFVILSFFGEINPSGSDLEDLRQTNGRWIGCLTLLTLRYFV